MFTVYSYITQRKLIYSIRKRVYGERGAFMSDPRKKRYLYLMLAGFGAISLSILLFFVLDRIRGIGQVLNSLKQILSPFIYGGVVAYLLCPMCNFYESGLRKCLPAKMHGVVPMAAVIGSMLTLFLAVYALGAMIFPQVYESIISLGKTIPRGIQNFAVWVEDTFGENEYVDRFLDYFNTSYDKLYQEVESWFRGVIPQISTLVADVGSSVFAVLRSIYNLLVGLIVAVYLLFGRKRYASQSKLIIHSIFSEKWANIILNEASLIDRMFGGFIDAKILDSTIIGILCYIGCRIMKMPNTLLISVFVGITNIIPFFGPLIGAVPSILLILIENPIKALWFTVFAVVLQQLDGNVIGPRIMGNRVGISGFWVMFAIIFFGGAWGLFGMIVGVPLFAVIYDLVRKLVKLGLKKKDKMGLWEQYTTQYPNEDLKQEQPVKKERAAGDWKAGGRQFLISCREKGKRALAWCKKAWELLKKWALAAWTFLQRLIKKPCDAVRESAASKEKKNKKKQK